MLSSSTRGHHIYMIFIGAFVKETGILNIRSQLIASLFNLRVLHFCIQIIRLKLKGKLGHNFRLFCFMSISLQRTLFEIQDRN